MRRFLSLMLCLVMLFAVSPAGVYAAEPEEAGEELFFPEDLDEEVVSEDPAEAPEESLVEELPTQEAAQESPEEQPEEGLPPEEIHADEVPSEEEPPIRTLTEETEIRILVKFIPEPEKDFSVLVWKKEE